MTKETKKTQKNKEISEVVEENKTAEQVSEKVEKTEKSKPEKENKVGLLLKEMRNKQGKSFAEISQDLCIRQSYLEAIENSDYNNIPEYPYGIGFIRSYADYLGLDGNNIVKMYKEEAEADFRKKHPYYVMEPQVEATVQSKKYLLISLVAIIVLYAAWNAYNTITWSTEEQEETPAAETLASTNTVVEENNEEFPLRVEDYSMVEETPANEVEQTTENAMAEVSTPAAEQENAPQQITMTNASFEEPAKQEETSLPKEEKNVTKEEPKAEVAKPGKSGLTVNVLKETWIEVKNDKTLYISKVLQAGDSYTLPKANDLKLSVGRADGVEIMYKGKKAYEVSPNKKMNISVDEIIAGAQD